MKIKYFNIKSSLFILVAGMLAFFACKEDEQIFPETRLFRPVLNEDLYSIGNSIIVNLGDMKKALSYTLEVSRDTFKTIDYTLETDTSFVVIDDALLNGDPLFWNTLYQVRATAHAESPEYDSRISDLGNVRTERFPTILNVPASYDVTDVAARVSWTIAGAPVTGVKVFAPSDLKLTTPLFDEHMVSAAGQESGETIITGLDPSSGYQVAIYSGEVLRGWVNYTTLVPDINPTDPNVIDIRENTSPSAVEDAILTAPDGSIILVKRGVVYDMPEENLTKSVTIRAAYGFGPQKAMLYTTGNWDIEDGSTIDHIRFIDLELRGEDMGGDYVFNPNRDNLSVGEVLFDNCVITNVRGIMRIRSTTSVDNFKIINSVVDSIGGYGLLTADTDPADPGNPMTAHVNNIYLKNSTFSEVEIGVQSRNNSESVIIEDCTFNNFPETGNRFLRYRGGDGNDNVTNGVSIVNSIFGNTWDKSGEGEYGGVRNEGMGSTNFNIVNVYSTANFSFDDEIPGFPVGNYGGTVEELWVNPAIGDYHIKDSGFAGRFSAGDPRWRPVL